MMDMKLTHYLTRGGALLGLVAAFGCNSLDVQNPNAPDAERAFSDPTAVGGLITGGFKTWFNTRDEFNSSLVLNGDCLMTSQRKPRPIGWQVQRQWSESPREANRHLSPCHHPHDTVIDGMGNRPVVVQPDIGDVG
jgi:hypothetical protein